MEIALNRISQSDFNYALECLEVCKQEEAKQFGFNYPYFTPGGYYEKQWWQIDSSVALSGYKWIDRKFAETSLLNFVESQKEDGRICLWGEDELPDFAAGDDAPKQRENVSSLPKLFDVSYHILNGTKDMEYTVKVYNCLKKYLDWWFLNRQDKKTGLITSVFEETFIPYLGCAGEYAGVDTNTEVYVGCHYVQLLAERLELFNDSEELEIRKENLRKSINTYLWSEEKGAYYPYDVVKRVNIDCLMASTFFPMRLGIATEDKRKKLIDLMKNDKMFNWNTIPLTSVSKKDRIFTTTKGDYIGNKSWSGNVWTLINEMVVRGLTDCGENKTAAELAWKTVKAFNHNCAEFLDPFDGSGNGVIKYAWTASQYIELIIEVIFGISYDASKAEVTIAPKLPEELKKSHINLKNIEIAQNIYLDVCIDKGRVTCCASQENIKFNVL